MIGNLFWRSFRSALIGGACAVSILHAQQRGSPRVSLLIPGAPYDGDSATVAHTSWTGVYRTSSGGWVIRAARGVTIARGEFGCFETKVVTADSVPPAFLLAVARLRTGPVDTTFNGHRFLYPGETVSWQLPGGWFVLRAGGTAIPGETGTAFTNYTIDLGSTTDRYASWQRLFTIQFGDTRPMIRWAGDIDGDGLLDLVLELPGGASFGGFVAYLSSAATDGRHVGEVGRFRVTDC